jgi:hypothetical protein
MTLNVYSHAVQGARHELAEIADAGAAEELGSGAGEEPRPAEVG